MNTNDQELLRQPAGDQSVWMPDPEIIFLNHGSFGSCPRPVLEIQRGLIDRMERRPIAFLARDLEPLLDEARGVLARFIGADADDMVFVQNATAGINTVLRALEFQAGDELLVTDQEYNACRNALEFVAARSGARVVVASVPFPFTEERQIMDAILPLVSARTRLFLIDHVTSQTGMVMPLERIVAEMSARGVDVLVDAAHAPGMIPLQLNKLGAAYYTGNCHKWLCTPKTAAFLHVRKDRQKLVRPLSISHGANSARLDRSRFLIEFAWTGTFDPTPFLCIPESIRVVGSLLPGGWPEVMARNRRLALAGRAVVCAALNIPVPCPDAFIGTLASIPLPPDEGIPGRQAGPFQLDPIQQRLLAEYAIEIPVFPWPAHPRRFIRISAQLYNSLPQYEALANALPKCLAG